MVRAGKQAQSSLPDAYRRWRASRLGTLTDALEEALILELIGSPAGLRILDAGCGDGALATALRATVRILTVSTPIRACWRRPARAEAMGLPRRSRRVISARCRSRRADVVVAVTVLCFVPDAEHAVREMARVLRPGGRLVIGELGRWNLWAAKRRIKGWFGSATWQAAKFRTAHELERLVMSAGLDLTATRGAIFYPPDGAAAALLAPCDPWLGRRTTMGAAFLAVAGRKPAVNRPKPRVLHASPEIAANPGRKDPFRPVRLHAGEPAARGARRQRPRGMSVPQVCVLDPDGDLVRRLRAAGRVHRDPAWACYHTDLYRLAEGGLELGLVGCAVGAPFAVLIAEQLFASGCRLLISMTSAGRLAELRPPPYFILIDRALRDEGTSYHYLPAADFSTANEKLLEAVTGAFAHLRVPVERGATWTTDAPFRETPEAIAAMTAKGLLAVEMEAAALRRSATRAAGPVLCARHQSDGARRGRLRKGRGGRNNRCPRCHCGSGAGVEQAIDMMPNDSSGPRAVGAECTVSFVPIPGLRMPSIGVI
jgi:SAM-dependent methyltransferase/nucleoside phosphorylase